MAVAKSIAGRPWWLLLTPWLLAQAAPDPGPPARISLDPNARISARGKMRVYLEGLNRGERVQLAVHKDCDGDGHAETEGREGCPNPLYQRESTAADHRGTLEEAFDFSEILGHAPLPLQENLWLRATRKGSARFVESRFTLEGGECSLVREVLSLLGLPCPAAPDQVLRRHRGGTDLAGLRFEVQVLSLSESGEAGAPPQAVPATAGATGVAWAGSRELLVTLAGGEATQLAGLYRLSPAAASGSGWQAPRQLWPAPAGLVAVAPLLLGEGRFAFGLQAPGPQLPAELAAPSRLKVLGPGGEEREIPLPFKLHQLLAADPARKHLLALSLGIEDAQPTLLWVSLETGQVENLGFEPALYQAALTRPGHREAALAWESNYGAEGWLISLFGPEGKLLRNLVERPNRQDLAPAWSPEGAELAFLAETPPEKAPPP